MTALDINGTRAKVSDNFLELSPEEQEKALGEIAGELNKKGQETRAPSGAAKHLGSGVVEAVADFVSIPGDLIKAGMHAARTEYRAHQ